MNEPSSAHCPNVLSLAAIIYGQHVTVLRLLANGWAGARKASPLPEGHQLIDASERAFSFASRLRKTPDTHPRIRCGEPAKNTGFTSGTFFGNRVCSRTV
jgi:hypothetical protein